MHKCFCFDLIDFSNSLNRFGINARGSFEHLFNESITIFYQYSEWFMGNWTFLSLAWAAGKILWVSYEAMSKRMLCGSVLRCAVKTLTLFVQPISHTFCPLVPYSMQLSKCLLIPSDSPGTRHNTIFTGLLLPLLLCHCLCCPCCRWLKTIWSCCSK